MLKNYERNRRSIFYQFGKTKHITIIILFTVGLVLCSFLSVVFCEAENGLVVAEDKNGYTVVQIGEKQSLISPEGEVLIEPDQWYYIDLQPDNHDPIDFSYTDYGLCLLIGYDHYAVYDLTSRSVVFDNGYQGIRLERYGSEVYLLAFWYENEDAINWWMESADDMPYISIFRWSDCKLIIQKKALTVEIYEDSNVMMWKIWTYKYNEKHEAKPITVFDVYSMDGKHLFSVEARSTAGFHNGKALFNLVNGEAVEYDTSGQILPD